MRRISALLVLIATTALTFSTLGLAKAFEARRFRVSVR
jgi:hypothetical protein